MTKYLTIFSLSWQDQFTYRLNFFLWRLRHLVRLLMTYFLWQGIFVTNQQVFGYSQSQMTTYVFLVLAVQSLILASPSSDNIGGEIASGDLSNYLIKPFSYLKFWFTRDLASKLLNLIFASGEVSLLWILLRPSLSFSPHLSTFISFLIICSLAVILYYFINVSTRFVAFWTPENTWGLAFLVLIFIEILAGGIFPLDILPTWASTALQFTPFPYLVYYPIAIFIGKITGLHLIQILLQTCLWVIAMYLLTNFLWQKGLKTYAAEGR